MYKWVGQKEWCDINHYNASVSVNDGKIMTVISSNQAPATSCCWTSTSWANQSGFVLSFMGTCDNRIFLLKKFLLLFLKMKPNKNGHGNSQNRSETIESYITSITLSIRKVVVCVLWYVHVWLLSELCQEKVMSTCTHVYLLELWTLILPTASTHCLKFGCVCTYLYSNVIPRCLWCSQIQLFIILFFAFAIAAPVII